jgi:hypothetical protein
MRTLEIHSAVPLERRDYYASCRGEPVGSGGSVEVMPYILHQQQLLAHQEPLAVEAVTAEDLRAALLSAMLNAAGAAAQWLYA